MIFKTLSGRLLLLTFVFFVLAEVLVLVPSISRFRVEFLSDRLERSQMASLALLATPSYMVDEDLEAELLRNAGVMNVALKRDLTRELVLSSPISARVEATFDLRDATWPALVRDAMMVVLSDGDRIVRVVGEPVKGAGQLIEVVMAEASLRDAMLGYGRGILVLSAVISVAISALIFAAVRVLMVRPISRLTRGMLRYAEQPEDAGRIIRPREGVSELYEAEQALRSMQTQLSQYLREKDRLASLGTAVSKISHDLRNILSTATLLADRLEQSRDPHVVRTAPKIVRSLSRAVSLCEGTLKFGRAEEPLPEFREISLREVLEDVVEGERLAVADSEIDISLECSGRADMIADGERIHRVATNLVRNARQALAKRGGNGAIRLAVAEDGARYSVLFSDDGPGIPERERESLFKPFGGGGGTGGTGLGLAISAELVQGHGGRLELVESGAGGTVFRMTLPRRPG